jgi:hypothetical protein
MLAEPGVRFGLATGAIVLALLAGSVGRLDATTQIAVAVVVASLSGAGLSAWRNLALGAVAWAFVTGFVENRYGQLTVAPQDLLRLVAFALLVPALAMAVHRAAVTPRG